MNRTYTVPAPGERWTYRQLEGFSHFFALLSEAERNLGRKRKEQAHERDRRT